MNRTWTLGLLSLLAACGGGAASRARTTTPPPSVAREDGLATRLAEIGRSLHQAGLAGRGELARGFLSGGEPATFEVEIPAHRCAAFVSLASPGLHDLDATLFAPDGTELASDTEPDAHPTVVACAEATARRAYVHLRAYAGAGAFVLAAFDGEDRALPALARIVGGRPGIAAAEGSASEDAARLRDFVLGAGRRGFEPRGEPADVTLAESQRVRVPLPVEPSTCVTVGAFGTGALANLDLRVLDEEGREVARDLATSRDAQAQACSDRRAEWTAEVVAAAGAGVARVQVLAGAQAETGSSGSLWLGERTDTFAATTTPPATAAHALLAARAMLVPGEAVAHPLATTLGADDCLALRATPGRGLVRLALLVEDARHARVASTEGTGGGAPTVLHVCGALDTPLTVVVAARGGSGEYTVEARAVSPPAGAPAALRAALLDADASAATAGLGRERAEAPSATTAVRLAPDECVRVVRLASAAAASRLVLREGGRTIAESAGLAPRASACAARGARTLEASTDADPDALLAVYRGHATVAATPAAP